jgi:putative phage-type endonuclease|tara:strand:+ start:2127 stop:2750 length:624 start_codon:yes stop_codon:yes gene_type:complete
MKILDLPQRSQEWFQARLGVITGSRAKQAFAKNNLPFMDELIAERLTGVIPDNFTSKAMEHGILFEPEAIRVYEEMTRRVVDEIGFCVHDDYSFIAVSPDGLIKIDGKYKGAVEVKCPSSKKHIEYMRIGKVPAEYKYQIIHYFVVNEDLEWLDFVSYDPRLHASKLHIHRVTREELAKEIDAALNTYCTFYEKLNKYEEQIKGGRV